MTPENEALVTLVPPQDGFAEIEICRSVAAANFPAYQQQKARGIFLR
jgi:hypothetical protein